MNTADIKFEKVSFDTFLKDFHKSFDKYPYVVSVLSEDSIRKIYDEIELPRRKTSGSAGYDFTLPLSVSCSIGEVLIPTGIRCKMPDNLVLMLFPRSSYGNKYGMILKNTVGIVDSDYYNADNEGHILASIKFISDNDKRLILEQGSSFIQGVFVNFYISEDDNVDEKREGGFGSTGK